MSNPTVEEPIQTISGTQIIPAIGADRAPRSSTNIPLIPAVAIISSHDMDPPVHPSQAKIERSRESVLSFDSLIDRNAPQLWLYFLTYLKEKPNITIEIHGYHTELQIGYTQQQDSDGNWFSSPVTNTCEIDDFRFSIDLFSYISDAWERILVDSKERSSNNSIRMILEQYANSIQRTKQLICDKQVSGWNFEDLTERIKALIQSAGYSETISINYSISCQRILARSSSTMNQMANSNLVRLLCVLSCLCLVFAPIYSYLSSATRAQHRLIAEYRLTESVDTFLQSNQALILQAIQNQSYQKFLATLN